MDSDIYPQFHQYKKKDLWYSQWKYTGVRSKYMRTELNTTEESQECWGCSYTFFFSVENSIKLLGLVPVNLSYDPI